VIWNDRFLFLHYPKAAGKSLSIGFIRAWGGKVCAHISKGQILELGPVIAEGSTLWINGAHQNAVQAQQILKTHDRDIRDFEAVFLAVRLPYDLICSTYFFHRRSAENGSTRQSFELATKSTLPEFVRQWKATRFEPWMQVGGEQLPNLRIIRFETMDRDFARYAKEFGFSNVRIPHLNSNKSSEYSGLITDELEEIIYNKYKLLFDMGLYQRRRQPAEQAAAG
jgi:hypothetical protein